MSLGSASLSDSQQWIRRIALVILLALPTLMSALSLVGPVELMGGGWILVMAILSFVAPDTIDPMLSILPALLLGWMVLLALWLWRHAHRPTTGSTLLVSANLGLAVIVCWGAQAGLILDSAGPAVVWHLGVLAVSVVAAIACNLVLAHGSQVHRLQSLPVIPPEPRCPSCNALIDDYTESCRSCGVDLGVYELG